MLAILQPVVFLSWLISHLCWRLISSSREIDFKLPWILISSCGVFWIQDINEIYCNIPGRTFSSSQGDVKLPGRSISRSRGYQFHTPGEINFKLKGIMILISGEINLKHLGSIILLIHGLWFFQYFPFSISLTCLLTLESEPFFTALELCLYPQNYQIMWT